MDESLPADQPRSPGAPSANLRRYAVVLLVGLLLVFVVGSAFLSGLDSVLAKLGVRMVASSEVPTPSRIDLLIAWFTASLALAELLHFFPVFPSNMTRWLIQFTYPKPLTWLRSMETGFLFMAIGALIAKTVFT